MLNFWNHKIFIHLTVVYEGAVLPEVAKAQAREVSGLQGTQVGVTPQPHLLTWLTPGQGSQTTKQDPPHQRVQIPQPSLRDIDYLNK